MEFDGNFFNNKYNTSLFVKLTNKNDNIHKQGIYTDNNGIIFYEYNDIHNYVSDYKYIHNVIIPNDAKVKITYNDENYEIFSSNKIEITEGDEVLNDLNICTDVLLHNTNYIKYMNYIDLDINLDPTKYFRERNKIKRFVERYIRLGNINMLKKYLTEIFVFN
jgi:hypothetical protein